MVILGGGGTIIGHMECGYKDIISVQNLCEAWCEFVRGKKSKKDVAEFSLNLSQNIFTLHEELKNRTYRHGTYEAFNISDPKPRNIHKATVRDRLLHHAIYKILYPHFDRKFIYDSYSCRNMKGTHRAGKRFIHFARKVSVNHKHTCWVLKCDIRKFFASVDQTILVKILKRHVSDEDVIWLVERVLESFSSGEKGVGLPLGNLTSQLLVNIYMNEFDQFVKHKLKVKYYIRYADDFIVMSTDRTWLLKTLSQFHDFLSIKLKLSLHPKKVFIKTFASGVDFLGWIYFSDHRVIRTTTKRRMFKRLKVNKSEATLQSYKGLLSHGNAHKLVVGITSLPHSILHIKEI